jgi:hypothetical protein
VVPHQGNVFGPVDIDMLRWPQLQNQMLMEIRPLEGEQEFGIFCTC